MKNIKNHVQLIGRLGANPTVKILEDGNKIVKFSIAVPVSPRNNSGKINKVQWYNIIAWDGLAHIAERLLHKGTQVIVDGRLSTKAFINKIGAKRLHTEIVANELLVPQSQLELEKAA